MTEEEAKTKWCPAVRHTRETDACFPSTNRGEIKTTAELNFKCIGSACMAWRDHLVPALTDEQADRLVEVGAPVGVVRLRKDGGYCGLACPP